MKETHIKIWTRSSLPVELSHLATFADDIDAPAENTVINAHLPQGMLEDETFKYISGSSNSDWMGSNLFGINCIDTIEHPENDGLILIGSCI